MPRVLNIRDTGYKVPEGAVYIGRPSKWGNPFKIGEKHPADGHPLTREEVIEYYKNALPIMLTDTDDKGNLILNLEELRGKDLVCHCAPLPCHGDILLELANRKPQQAS